MAFMAVVQYYSIASHCIASRESSYLSISTGPKLVSYDELYCAYYL